MIIETLKYAISKSGNNEVILSFDIQTVHSKFYKLLTKSYRIRE